MSEQNESELKEKREKARLTRENYPVLFANFTKIYNKPIF